MILEDRLCLIGVWECKQDLYENFSISLYQILPATLFLRVESENKQGTRHTEIYNFCPTLQWGLISLVILSRLVLAAGHGIRWHWVELRDPSILNGQNYYEYLYTMLKNKFEWWPL